MLFNTKQFKILLTGTYLDTKVANSVTQVRAENPVTSISHMLLDCWIIFLLEEIPAYWKWPKQKTELNTPANAESQHSTLPLSLYGL